MKERILMLLCLLLGSVGLHAQVYTWKDERGHTHFSDKNPNGILAETVEVETTNVVDPGGVPIQKGRSGTKDTFVMPDAWSNLPFEFVLTSAVVDGSPADDLASVQFDQKQTMSYGYVRLKGVNPKIHYALRIRVLDASQKLIFDSTKEMDSTTGALWFAVSIHPMPVLDTPGQWTFQGLLNNKSLFVESRTILFNKQPAPSPQARPASSPGGRRVIPGTK